jgi:PAS domain S-box-containing protein
MTTNRDLIKDSKNRPLDDTIGELAREHEFRTLAENLPDNIVRYDREGRSIYVNPQLRKLLGADAEVMIGKLVREIYPDGSYEVYAQTLDAVLTSGENREIEFVVPGTEKNPIIHQIRMIAVRDEHGEVSGALAIGRDITERKRAEAALIASEQQFRSLAENSPDNVIRYDRQSRASYYNPRMVQTLGVAPEKILGLTPVQLGAGGLVSDTEYEGHIRRALEGGESNDMVLTLQHPGGGVSNHLIRFAPERNAAGSITGVLAIGRDITALKQAEQERKAAENSLRESEAKFRALVESTSDWIWEMDERGVYTYSSPQVFDLLGYTVEEVVGKTPFDLMTQEDATRLGEQFCAIVARRSHFRLMENANRHKDGRIVFLETSGAPIFDVHGVFGGYRGIDRDITERKRSEKALHENANKLEQLLMQTINAISATVEARDPYTAGHEQRVSVLAGAIARVMGLSAETIHGITLAGSIHDLGKIRVPAEILSKPGKLNPIEYELVKCHPQTGYDIVKDIQFSQPIAQMVLQHHERLDGSGYPQRLKGGQILIEAQILGVADVVEAMSSHRPYRPGLGMDAALEEIAKNRGVLYDPAVVDSCLALFRDNLFSFDHNKSFVR